MQRKLNKFLVVIMALALLGIIGCTPPQQQTSNTNNTTQNTNYNSNESNKNVSNENVSEEMLFDCSSVTQGQLEDAILKQLGELKYQFKKFNPPAGTADLTYNPTTQELIFKGSLLSDAGDLTTFLKVFDKFRSKKCARKVSFQGKTPAENFEWTFTSNPSSNAGGVKDIINNGKLKDQVNQNFFYNIPDGSTVLTLTGHVNDVPSKKRFKEFSDELGSAITNGNVTKIVFGKSAKTLMMEDFYWGICDGNQEECNGTCVPRGTCGGGNTNTGNVNKSANTSTNMNANTTSNSAN